MFNDNDIKDDLLDELVDRDETADSAEFYSDLSRVKFFSRVLSVFHPKSCAKPYLEIKRSMYVPQKTFYTLYKSVKWDHGGKNGLDEHIDVVFELLVYLTVTDIMIKYRQALVHTKIFFLKITKSKLTNDSHTV